MNENWRESVRRTQLGFTLMEMIGVVAVVAILATMATPMIFKAIQDSRISATLQQARQVETAIARFYADTGRWPIHRTPIMNPHERQLIANTAEGGGTIPGWDGPYLDAELRNLLTPGSEMLVYHETRDNEKCDVDGDGTPDANTMILRINDLDDDVARNLSDAIDNDFQNTSGTAAWDVAGRARRGVFRPNAMIICLSQT